MKHSIFALPALLRPALLLAAASQNTFSVQDDLLAFPQFEVKFSEDFVSESKAQSRLKSNEQLLQSKDDAPPSEIEHYRQVEGRAGNDGKREDEGRREHEYMVLDGQPYLCSVPQVSKPAEKSNVNDTSSKAEEEKELARATDRGWELLAGMQGNCVYYISGWWSYRFCYGEGVRQFHQLPPSRGVPVYPPMEDPGVEGYTLGKYNKTQKQEDGTKKEGQQSNEVQSVLDESGLAAKKKSSSGYGELVQRGENRYLVQRLEGGTKCDLTNRERKVEVQFHCSLHPSDRISLIKETATCSYLMVIQTPRLCNDVAFLPPVKDQPNAITCSPILAEEQIEDYKHDLRALKSAEKEAKIWEANADAAKVFLGTEGTLQIVGDIIVGGHNIVPEDVKLEKSAVVGGGKETYVDTIASSDGKVLPAEDLKKLGLGDSKSIERLKQQLEKMAQGADWKLDVIDTPRGREYRGIIGSDEEEDDKKKEKEKEGKGEDGASEGSKEEYYYKEEL